MFVGCCQSDPDWPHQTSAGDDIDLLLEVSKQKRISSLRESRGQPSTGNSKTYTRTAVNLASMALFNFVFLQKENLNENSLLKKKDMNKSFNVC